MRAFAKNSFIRVKIENWMSIIVGLNERFEARVNHYRSSRIDSRLINASRGCFRLVSPNFHISSRDDPFFIHVGDINDISRTVLICRFENTNRF